MENSRAFGDSDNSSPDTKSESSNSSPSSRIPHVPLHVRLGETEGIINLHTDRSPAPRAESLSPWQVEKPAAPVTPQEVTPTEVTAAAARAEQLQREFAQAQAAQAERATRDTAEEDDETDDTDTPKTKKPATTPVAVPAPIAPQPQPERSVDQIFEEMMQAQQFDSKFTAATSAPNESIPTEPAIETAPQPSTETDGVFRYPESPVTEHPEFTAATYADALPEPPLPAGNDGASSPWHYRTSAPAPAPAPRPMHVVHMNEGVDHAPVDNANRFEPAAADTASFYAAAPSAERPLAAAAVTASVEALRTAALLKSESLGRQKGLATGLLGGLAGGYLLGRRGRHRQERRIDTLAKQNHAQEQTLHHLTQEHQQLQTQHNQLRHQQAEQSPVQQEYDQTSARARQESPAQTPQWEQPTPQPSPPANEYLPPAPLQAPTEQAPPLTAAEAAAVFAQEYPSFRQSTTEQIRPGSGQQPAQEVAPVTPTPEQVAALQPEQPARQPQQHIEHSAWHNIVVDEHGREVPNAIQYGQGFQQERQQEHLRDRTADTHQPAIKTGIATSQSYSDWSGAVNPAAQYTQTPSPEPMLPPGPPTHEDPQHLLPPPHRTVASVLLSPWFWLACGLLLLAIFGPSLF